MSGCSRGTGRISHVPQTAVCSVMVSRAVVPNLFGTRDWFLGRQFFHGPGGGWGDGFGMIQVLYILGHVLSILGTLVLEGSPRGVFWLSALGKAGHCTDVERKPLHHTDNVRSRGRLE